MTDDVADFSVVDAAFDGSDEGGRNALLFEIFQRLLPDPAQIRAAQMDQRLAFERIELQVHFQTAFVFRQPRHEVRLARDPQAVGVDHDMTYRPRPHRIEDRKEIRMQGRLATGNLHQIGLAFACHQRVEHFLDGAERRETCSLRQGFGEAHRAGQVAVFGDLDQGQAGMLFMVRTQPAIERTAEFGVALKRQRLVAGLDEFLAAAPIVRIGRDQGRLHAMLLAAFLVPDLLAPNLDLGRHQREADFTQRLGLAPENIGARSTQQRVLGRVHASTSWWVPSPA